MIPPFSELDKIARCAAGAYKRRGCRADFDDLRQEAWVAILLARRSFDVSRGTPFEAYAWSGALRWLRGYLWRSSAPVSASFHALVELRGIKAVRGPDKSMPDMRGGPDEVVDAKRSDERVLAAARRALEPLGEYAEPALLVITGLAAPSELTPEGKQARRELYHKLSEARFRLACSLELWQVWRERENCDART